MLDAGGKGLVKLKGNQLHLSEETRTAHCWRGVDSGQGEFQASPCVLEQSAAFYRRKASALGPEGQASWKEGTVENGANSMGRRQHRDSQLPVGSQGSVFPGSASETHTGRCHGERPDWQKLVWTPLCWCIQDHKASSM